MFGFDIHLHTRTYSDCSFIEPEALIQKAIQLNLQGIALTEHGMRWPDDKFEELRRLAAPSGLSYNSEPCGTTSCSRAGR